MFHGHEARQQRAEREFAGAYRVKAHVICPSNWQSVEAARAIRNLLAHRSKSAGDAVLREQDLTPLNTPLIQALMRAHAATADLTIVEIIYRAHTDGLARVVNADPADSTADLHRHLVSAS